MKSLWPVYALVSLISLGCGHDLFDPALPGNDHFIFGRYAGECSGNCVVLFKISHDRLFADDTEMDFPPTQAFQDIPLSDSLYQLARVLVEEFPDELFDSSVRTYGCPDCHDQGGLYLEVRHNGHRDSWFIDTGVADQSDWLLEYKDKIRSVMDQLP